MTSTIEPRWAGSMRRSATVTSSVPDARIASRSASSREKPPVPRIRRERKVRSAITSGSASEAWTGSVAMRAAPLDGVEDLDAIARGEGASIPLRARDDLGVDGHRESTPWAFHVEALEDIGHGGVLRELGRLTVD